MSHYYALIMAGGGGTRLWPVSRHNRPKQLLKLINDETMFEMSVRRLAPVFTPDRVYVVTGAAYVDAMRQETPDIPADNFIVEPSGKDSAAAAGLGISVIQQRDPDAIVAILTADHHITLRKTFRDVLSAAAEIAAADNIVTLGMSPTYAATGFGYIKQGEQRGEVNGHPYYEALQFTEKPDVVRATQFVASGRYSWNGGMFIWRAERAMREFERQQPEMHALFMELQPHVDTPTFADKLADVWQRMPKKSIDYAIMEGAQQMVVIPTDIGWTDVGSWASLYDVLKQDRFGNCIKGEADNNRIILDTRNTLIYSDRLTVTIGVEDMIIVDSDDVLMICRKDRAQDVKEVVNYLRDNDSADYL